MINAALGMELEKAKAYLTEKGFRVTQTQVRSRKGVDGDAARVIRVRRTAEDGVELCYSIFKTGVDLPQ